MINKKSGRSPLETKTLKKGGYRGDKIWHAHRLEGVVKNRSIKKSRKAKKGS